jgi:hypothetical protein
MLCKVKPVCTIGALVIKLVIKSAWHSSSSPTKDRS